MPETLAIIGALSAIAAVWLYVRLRLRAERVLREQDERRISHGRG